MKSKKNKANSNSKMIITAVITGVLVIAAIVVFLQQEKEKKLKEAKAVVSGTTEEDVTIDYNTIKHEGKIYKYNTNLRTILFLGIDQRDPVEANGYIGTGGRSDTMILLILDQEKKTITQLKISRDTMAKVDICDSDAKRVGEDTMQITMQHAFGDGQKKSLKLSKKAVSALLYGIPIQNGISINMDGIGAIVNALGGIEITMPEDYTMINPQFVKGTTLTLDGGMAEQYVRWRDTNVDGSNNQRMERQSHFINTLVTQIKTRMHGNAILYYKLLKSVGPYMVTDIDGAIMKDMVTYELLPTEYKIPGENKVGEMHDEYIVNDKELYQMIIELFYK